jgi:hypothetical protein
MTSRRASSTERRRDGYVRHPPLLAAIVPTLMHWAYNI